MEISVLFCFVKGEKSLVIQMEISSIELKKKSRPRGGVKAGDKNLHHLLGSGRTILEKEMATHSNILARRIPWTEEPGGLQSIESQRVRHH